MFTGVRRNTLSRAEIITPAMRSLSQFTCDPYNNAVQVDQEGRFFVTPVSWKRFSVVWQKSGDHDFFVEGVVLAQFDPAKEGKLLEQVRHVLRNQGNEAGLSI